MNQPNGRINIIQPDTNKQFSLYDKIPIGQTSAYSKALVGQQESSMLSTVYFSKENIEIVHNAIRAGVYKRSNGRYTIGPQNIDTLKIIMRSIYLQHSLNKPCNITNQVENLNKLVVDYAIPQVFGEVEGYIKYRHDVSTLAVPMTRPANMSSAGSNTLELNPFF